MIDLRPGPAATIEGGLHLRLGALPVRQGARKAAGREQNNLLGRMRHQHRLPAGLLLGICEPPGE